MLRSRVMVLDVGCGKKKIEANAIGIDMSPDSAADHVWNLDQYPWPLAADCFDRIHMSHVIEHLEDPMRAMAEVWRVARNGADVFVTTPHFSSHNSYTDPTHRRHLAALNPPNPLHAPAPPPPPRRGQFRVLHRKRFPDFRRVRLPLRHRAGRA